MAEEPIGNSERACWIGAPEMFELNQACRPIVDAYGHCVYLVGSCLKKRDYRDVDVRVILSDEKFDELFPGIRSNHQLDARWSLMCSAISLWLNKHSGLPIDFQIQRRTQANEEFNGPRHPLGFFLNRADRPWGE